MVNGIRLACGQITWRRDEFTQDEILRQIAEAGYQGAPASAPDLASVDGVRARFEQAGLTPAPGYLGAPFWEAEQADEIVQRAAQMAEISKAFGLTELYVAANLTPERRKIAGQVTTDDGLGADEFKVLADTLNRVGEATLGHGVRSSFHNHVGSFIETREEVDRLFAMVDQSLVFHGPDLGHLAWAGGDSVSYLRDYLPNITTIHVKDINPDVLREGVASKWDYGQFSDHGIFTELGQGILDFPGIFDLLKSANWSGWIVVETDVTQLPTALESAKISRDYLRSVFM